MYVLVARGTRPTQIELPCASRHVRVYRERVCVCVRERETLSHPAEVHAQGRAQTLDALRKEDPRAAPQLLYADAGNDDSRGVNTGGSSDGSGEQRCERFWKVRDMCTN